MLNWLSGGKLPGINLINVVRAGHPAWFRKDLEGLFGLLVTRAVRSRVAERISFDDVAEAHRRLEAGGLEGKLVLSTNLPSQLDQDGKSSRGGGDPGRSSLTIEAAESRRQSAAEHFGLRRRSA